MDKNDRASLMTKEVVLSSEVLNEIEVEVTCNHGDSLPKKKEKCAHLMKLVRSSSETGQISFGKPFGTSWMSMRLTPSEYLVS